MPHLFNDSLNFSVWLNLIDLCPSREQQESYWIQKKSDRLWGGCFYLCGIIHFSEYVLLNIVGLEFFNSQILIFAVVSNDISDEGDVFKAPI